MKMETVIEMTCLQAEEHRRLLVATTSWKNLEGVFPCAVGGNTALLNMLVSDSWIPEI